MEALSKSLSPYKDLVATVASYVTIAQFFSGAFICNDIRKQGNTKDITAIPFIGGIMMGIVMLKYALILNDEAMLTVNFAAIGLNIIYAAFYYLYSEDKWEEFLKPLSYASAVVAALWGYAEWEDPQLVEFRYGLISTVLMLALLGSPLLGLKEIINDRDASSIPFVLTLMGTLVTFAWLLYGIILLNSFMIVQNVIGFLLCLSQLILIFVYPGTATKPVSVKKKKN